MKVAVLLVAIAGLGAAAPAQAQNAGEGPAINEALLSTESGGAPAEWTEARMEQATPTEPPDDTGLATGTPATVTHKDAPAAGSNADDPHPGGFELQASGDPASRPLRYSGKLFFSKPGGGDYSCSAQFIAPRVVLTAAHCVRDSNGGGWYTNFNFALQYHRGQSLKQYRSQCLTTKQGWVKRSAEAPVERRWDYAMILVQEDSPTGYFGWSYDWRGYYDQAYKIGYPGQIERGKVIQVDGGPLFFANNRPGVVMLRHGNPNNRKGSSGGAWVANFSGTHAPNLNRIVSVTSGSNDRTPDVSVGPYFDQNFVGMLQYVSRGCR